MLIRQINPLLGMSHVKVMVDLLSTSITYVETSLDPHIQLGFRVKTSQSNTHVKRTYRTVDTIVVRFFYKVLLHCAFRRNLRTDQIYIPLRIITVRN